MLVRANTLLYEALRKYMVKMLERLAGSADTQGSILVTPSEDDVHRDLYANSNHEPAMNIFSKCNAESRIRSHCLAGTCSGDCCTLPRLVVGREERLTAGLHEKRKNVALMGDDDGAVRGSRGF